MSAENDLPGQPSEFIVDTAYPGYVFLGWASGRFEANTAGGKEKRPYHNMYVLSPVSTFRSDDYEAFGLKAEKKSCLSPEVWSGLAPGDRVKLFFDDKGRVQMAAIDS